MVKLHSIAIILIMMTLNTANAACPVETNRLTKLDFSYYDFNGKLKNDGQILVLDVVADHVKAIFHELQQLKFPLQESKLIDAYNNDDNISMLHNNSCSFNCREATGKPGIYSHS